MMFSGRHCEREVRVPAVGADPIAVQSNAGSYVADSFELLIFDHINQRLAGISLRHSFYARIRLHFEVGVDRAASGLRGGVSLGDSSSAEEKHCKKSFHQLASVD